MKKEENKYDLFVYIDRVLMNKNPKLYKMLPKFILRYLKRIAHQDEQILMYPAGLASRKTKSKIRDLEWKKTVISKAVKYKRDIIPVHISGILSNFFYNFANLRKFPGIKANLEMLYLSDETFKQRNKSFEITFEKPILYETFGK